MNKKAVVFLILFLLSFFVSLFLNVSKINIPNFNGLNKKISIDIFFKENKQSDVFLDNQKILNKFKIDNNHYLFVQNNFKNVKNINFSNLENIEKIQVYIGYKLINVNKPSSNIEINNSKNIFDKILISILSFFYNFQFYILSYIFLFFFLSNFKNRFKTKKILISILTFGFLIRLCEINSVPFWDDEIYVLAATAKYSPISALFNDAGNPPFYFILFKIYRLLINNPVFFKFSSVLIGTSFIFFFYLYLKKNIGTKNALFGAFLASINIILIHFSQEIRCYMLLMFLAILNSLFLLNFNPKKTKGYLISTILILYTHFYAAFLIFYNFIFGIIFFFKNKFKLINFIRINIIAFICYLPLIIYKKTSITSNFNSWIQIPTLIDYTLSIKVFCLNFFVFLSFFSLLFYIYFKTNKKQKIFILYNVFAIISIFILAILFTYSIKPIFCYRYFYIVFAHFIALVILAITYKYNKIRFLIPILIFIFCFISQRINYQKLFCNHNLYLDFIQKDIDYKKQNYIFMSDTVSEYKEFKDRFKNAKIIYLPINTGIKTLDLNKYDIQKPSTVYVLNLYLDENTLNKAKIELYKTNLGVFSKVEFN